MMESIHSDSAPAAIGPYSQAQRIDSWVFTSGQVALDARSGAMLDGPADAQTAKALANLEAVLAAAGCTRRDVIKTTVFLKDMNDFAGVNAVYADFFGAHKPARSTVEVARLPKDALVEIDCIAIKR